MTSAATDPLIDMPTRPVELASPIDAPSQIAKAALRRLGQDRLEPTPENYARAYALESGAAPAVASSAIDGAMLAALIERVVGGVERGGRNWTAARRKDGLRRVLDGSRSDAVRLQQRLLQLVSAWDSDATDPTADSAFGDPDLEPQEASTPRPMTGMPGFSLDDGSTSASPPVPLPKPGLAWHRVVTPLADTVQLALPTLDDRPHEVAEALAELTARLHVEGATTPLIEALEAICGRAAPVLQHRHHLVRQLGNLCLELTASLTDLAENDSWAQGQCAAMRVKIDEGLTARGVRAVNEMLRHTRERHGQMRSEREQARDALKGLINRMLTELDELGSCTGHFHDSVGRYAEVIEQADSLESLAGAVREMVEESRSVQTLVQQTQTRLHDERSHAVELTRRVAELEGEMRRLSDEVSTDQLTQIANRRGLLQAFEAERAQARRDGDTLSVGLLDIDNFKRLNDQLGHGAGDEALKALAALITATLRPTDRVARYGGEEFVVLMPATEVDEGQKILTRLQRSLTGGLFMHEQKTVFVTFSAGVTAYRLDERLEDALERADQALYMAKGAGKNRTCVV